MGMQVPGQDIAKHTLIAEIPEDPPRTSPRAGHELGASQRSA